MTSGAFTGIFCFRSEVKLTVRVGRGRGRGEKFLDPWKLEVEISRVLQGVELDVWGEVMGGRIGKI